MGTRKEAAEAENEELVRASGRVPPNNLGAEIAVLGSILLDNRVLELLPPTFGAGDFFRAPHQVIYEAMLALSAKEQPIDVLTLTEHLRETGRLGAASGAAYLAGLTAQVPSAANATRYAEVIQQKALRRRLMHAHSEGVRLAQDDTVDVQSLLSRSEEMLALAVANAEVKRRREADVVRDLLARAQGADDQPVRAAIRTGLPTLDRFLRISEEDVVVVAAPTGGGKSIFMEQVAGENGMCDGARAVLIASLEMSGHQLGERRLMDAGSLTIDDVRNPRTNDAASRLVSAVEEVARTSRVEYLQGCYDLGAILREALRWHRQLLAQSAGKEGLAAVVVDYVQILDLDADSGDIREQQIAHATRTLKRFASRHKIPVIVASQLRRTNGRVPTKDDLRESGAIANDADAIVILYIPGLVEGTEEYKRNDKRTALAIIAKQRQGPSWVEIELVQVFEHARFAEKPVEGEEPEQQSMGFNGGKRRVQAS